MALSLALIAAALVAGQDARSPEPKRVTSLTGQIVHVPNFESKTLGNRRNLIVYLPPGYDQDKRRRYPVLYLHDGQNVFDGMTSYLPNKEWKLDEAAESLIKAGLIEPIIMVGIDNGSMERANEYLPTRFKMGQTEMGGKADLYGKMLIDEIKPMVDSKYRTKRDARNTGLMGSSFGGVITLHLGLTRSDVFGRLGVVSPSLWVDNRLLLRAIDRLPKKLPLKVWLDMGSAEGPGALKDSQDAAAAFQKKGWVPAKDFVYYEDAFAVHNEDAWARRSPAILMFLFGKR